MRQTMSSRVYLVSILIMLTLWASVLNAKGLAQRHFTEATFFLYRTIAMESGAGQAPDVFMSSDIKGEERADSFDCHDDIYIHAVFFNLEDNDHEASVEWINPKGLRQSNYSHRFKEVNYHAWFNLKLDPAFGGRFLKTLDPSAGMDEFIGRWSVRFYLDGKLIVDKMFYVAC